MGFVQHIPSTCNRNCKKRTYHGPNERNANYFEFVFYEVKQVKHKAFPEHQLSVRSLEVH